MSKFPGLQPSSWNLRSLKGTHGYDNIRLRPTLTSWNSDLALGNNQLPRKVLRVHSRCHGFRRWWERRCYFCAVGDPCWPSLVVGCMGIESVAGAGHSSWLDEGSHRYPAPTWPSARRFRRFSSTLKETCDSDNRLQLGHGSQVGRELMGFNIGFEICIMREFRKYRPVIGYNTDTKAKKTSEHTGITFSKQT